MSEIVIKAEGIGKKYRIKTSGRSRYLSLRDELSKLFLKTTSQPNTPKDEFWALKDINFEIKQGEIVGIVGRNGAGKSTLLKLIARITTPSEGKLTITGRVSSLLEIGTGFHPELTGRENIYLSGTILGMNRTEIKQKFDEIVDFAGVEKFLETPVKRYSSGMFVRLGFSVAAHLDTEILLVDEVLAVGDMEFQRKCFGKMTEISGLGKTILFVSHNLSFIQKNCPQTLLLEQARSVAFGPTDRIIQSYIQTNQQKPSFQLNSEKDPSVIRLKNLSLANSEEIPNAQIRFGEPFSLIIELEGKKTIKDFSIIVGLNDSHGKRILSGISYQSNAIFSIQEGEEKQIKVRFDNLFLRPGFYSVYISILKSKAHRYNTVEVKNCLEILEWSFVPEKPFEGYWGELIVFPKWTVK